MNIDKPSNKVTLKQLLIFVGAVVAIIIISNSFKSEPAAKSVSETKEATLPPVTPKELAAMRMKRAKSHFPEIEETVKRRCSHPLTADISYYDAEFTAIDSTAENVAVQGTGTAKNSFGVPDKFTYTAYMFINLDGKDSLYMFDVR